MTTDDEIFWKQVYIAAIRAGSSGYTARAEANKALNDLNEARNNL